MSIVCTLICDECGRHSTFKPYLRATKMGTLRMQGGTEFGWYVDGGKVLCREHAPSELPLFQKETWAEQDRREADNDREHEEYIEREKERLGI